MRKIAVILLLLGFTLTGWTQQGMKKIDPVGEFNGRLAQAATKIRSIESDFVQVKYLDVFSEKITSKGKFYFKREDMICLEYTHPMDYLMVINGQKLKIVSDGRSNVVNLGTNQLMAGMKGMLAGCMVGDLTRLSVDYQLEYFEDAGHYLVKVRPLNKNVQAYLTEIDIRFEKKDMSVKSLRLVESGKDYTEYEFTDRKYNTLTTDEKFVVR